MDSLDKRIKRGKESWMFIYTTYGLVLAIMIFFISILSFEWYYQVIIFGVIFSVLTWLFLFSAWFQNKIIGLKIRLEETWRKI